jgi:hypothetical protein
MTKEHRPPRERTSSRFPLGDQVPASPGRPRRQGPRSPEARWRWKELQRPSPRGPPRSSYCGSPSGDRVSETLEAISPVLPPFLPFRRSPIAANGRTAEGGHGGPMGHGRTASVVGMTYGACHVPSYLPAGVPGVSTARRQEDQLRPEDRLRQQPADDSAVEGQNRAMRTKAHQWLFRRKWASPDKSDRGQGRE